MGLQQSISAELQVSIKNRDRVRTGAVRILIGEFQRQPEKVLSDEQGYLPKQASEEEIRKWIQENIDFSVFKNKMQAMKPIMAHFGSSVDGNTVKNILQTIS